MNRRTFLRHSIMATCCLPWLASAGSEGDVTIERIRGLLLGSAIGDALGGPIEFQSKEAVARLGNAPKNWPLGEKLDAPGRAACAARLRLRSYEELRPEPGSYAHWELAAGTVTDDTRHKLVLLHGLATAESAEAWPFSVQDLARAYLDWPQLPVIAGRAEYRALAQDWLEEWQFAARWVLGERDLSQARPPERMWQSLPTCCGQMTLLPLAALYAGQPERAYRAAWSLAFFDNGFGRDMNAALVAALAQALVVSNSDRSQAWRSVLEAVRRTDPFQFAEIRYTQRPVLRWLDFALQTAQEANGEPARMFEVFEMEFAENAKWEAQVPFVVMFGCLALAQYDPLAALQLSMEWGHDTDSYAQLMGAFIGALEGEEVFPLPWREAVSERMQTDFGVNLGQECERLRRLHKLGEGKALVKIE